MARQVYGMHAPIKMMMERDIVGKVRLDFYNVWALGYWTRMLTADAIAGASIFELAFGCIDGQGRNYWIRRLSKR